MPKPRICSLDWLRTRSVLLLVAASVLVPILLINPFREMLSEDDSWAYARMVEHLLKTGKYGLDAWSAANMPVQIYLAAAASRVFDYSLTTLRITTLTLFMVGLSSFYLLLREFGRDRATAALATCAFVASPLVLMLAFTFMTDVQFLGWLLLALWLYVRGISRASLAAILLGSIAAGCAIGTRQFGIAIVAGFLASWLLCSRKNRLPPRFFLAGLGVPLCFAGAQVYIGLRGPNFTQAYRMFEVHTFLSNPVSVLVPEVAWRVVVILQYAGICLIPLLPMALWPGRDRSVRKYAVILAACAAVMAMLAGGSPLTARPEAQHHGLWEPLELYWLLPTQLKRIHWAMRLLDLGGIVGAGCLVWMLVGIFRPAQLRSPRVLLLTGTGATLLVLHLIYVQLNDTYISALIPLALVIASETVGREVPRALYLVSASLCLAVILGTSLWMRAEYAGQQATWASADALLKSGVPPQEMQAPLHWAEYHGAFDDWIEAGAPGFSPSQPSYHGTDVLHDPFYAWLTARSAQALYEFRDSPATYESTEWQPIRTVTYRNARFSEHQLVTLRRRH